MEHVHCWYRYICIYYNLYRNIVAKEFFCFPFLPLPLLLYWKTRDLFSVRFLRIIIIIYTLFVDILFRVNFLHNRQYYYSTRRHCVSPSLMTFIYNLDSRHARRMIRGSDSSGGER